MKMGGRLVRSESLEILPQTARSDFVRKAACGRRISVSCAAPPITSEYCELHNPPGTLDYDFLWDQHNGYTGHDVAHDTYTRSAQTQWTLFTGGKATPKRYSLWRLSASAGEVLDKQEQRPFPGGMSTRPIPSQDIIVDGSHLGTDGVLWKVLPDGTNVDVTAKVNGVDFYTFGVGAGKYKSHYEVFVRQPWADLTHQPWLLSDDPQPIGWPVVNGFDAGHAWWELSSDAPLNEVQKLTTESDNDWLNRDAGYGPEDPSVSRFDWGRFWVDGIVKTAPGKVFSGDNGNPNIHRTYRIGFQARGLIEGLNHTKHLSGTPGTWDSSIHNCVDEVVITGNVSGIAVPGWDNTPEGFGFHLPPDNP